VPPRAVSKTGKAGPWLKISFRRDYRMGIWISCQKNKSGSTRPDLINPSNFRLSYDPVWADGGKPVVPCSRSRDFPPIQRQICRPARRWGFNGAVQPDQIFEWNAMYCICSTFPYKPLPRFKLFTQAE
jgi:hypothetical protein